MQFSLLSSNNIIFYGTLLVAHASFNQVARADFSSSSAEYFTDVCCM
jgi:hypothetical protein